MSRALVEAWRSPSALTLNQHSTLLSTFEGMDKSDGMSWTRKKRAHNRPRLAFGFLIILVSVLLAAQFFQLAWLSPTSVNLPPHASETISRCRSLQMKAGPSEGFDKREQSDRFVSGTKPYLLINARIWTGLENGTEVVRGDVLIDKGIIKGVGHFGRGFIANARGRFADLEVVDVGGKWLTPGIVDMHSHIGDASSPALDGSEDDNSLAGTAQPWLRSLDGLNTHDDSYLLSISGGVTTSLVLPGSANAIGGQAYLIKLRETAERTPSSMLLEAPYQINSSFPDPNLPLHWRHMKHACGENPSRVYGVTRMDTIWAFRESYNKAQGIKEKQDAYCARASKNEWAGLGDFPEDLQWEALVDVLRGRVKVNIHCYEAVDLDALVRLSNEFSFPIAAFHHASEAYLVPDTLKKAYGSPPAIALFATNSRYKREAYRASEFAPRILTSHGLKVAMKSDHPVLNSRFLLYEAQQAYFYGMPENAALASVISTPAEVIGMGHRLGFVRKGWDADLVLWDSHPLALGATPVQVFIDGIPQLSSPHVNTKHASFQHPPKVPNFDKEVKQALKYEGLQPLEPTASTHDVVVFTNVKDVFTAHASGIMKSFSASHEDGLGVVVVRGGKIECSGQRATCFANGNIDSLEADVVDLEGGSISPGLLSFGAPLGLEVINQEPTTNDGLVGDALRKPLPKILGGDTAVVRAVDGLEFGTRDALLAYRAGVTSAVTAPLGSGFFSGLGTAFSLSAKHKLEQGSIVKEVTGFHIAVRHNSKGPSISTQIALLRRLLLAPVDGALGHHFRDVKKGVLPLVIEAHSADIIATLILLKREVEREIGSDIRMTISGATEAHLLAKELAQAVVGVVVRPSRPFPYVWEDRRLMPGPPLTKESAISKLLSYNVTVGIGIEELWSARNTRFDLAWAAIETGLTMSEEDTLALGSINLRKLLGVPYVEDDSSLDMVATCAGSLLSMDSKVVAVISSSIGRVDFF
ncbi:carbohydrate esterase family 9 protein [Pleurotus eryngii]|uniref:Carbohydrate esterase family 9 protein n=1 Tax=Pleurotus eryngii TaxID=5323 RepID=A0A9P6DK86_PLEER|nr:carbohydrate esterase family 9 protein [Pleurotus eryngii]